MNEQTIHNVKTKELLKTVLELMEQDTNCRNFDNYLIFKVWSKELRRSEMSIEDARRVTTAKDIYNARQTVQNKMCILLPTLPGILTQRKVKAELVRSYYGDCDLTRTFEEKKFNIK